MGDVVSFGGITTVPEPADDILQRAVGQDLELVMVVGWKDGELWFSGNRSETGDLLLCLELAKQEVMKAATEGRER